MLFSVAYVVSKFYKACFLKNKTHIRFCFLYAHCGNQRMQYSGSRFVLVASWAIGVSWCFHLHFLRSTSNLFTQIQLLAGWKTRNQGCAQTGTRTNPRFVVKIKCFWAQRMYVRNGFDLGNLSMQTLYVLDVCVWFNLFVYIYCLMNVFL